jgi:uncharacterized protein YceK
MRLLVLLSLLPLAGCSTVATIAGSSEPEKFQCDPDYTIPRVYSGIANDIRYLCGNYQDKGLVFWDIPFSLVADTVALPYTVFTQTKYGNLCTKKQEPTE